MIWRGLCSEGPHYFSVESESKPTNCPTHSEAEISEVVIEEDD